LLPIPAPFRCTWELRGYQATEALQWAERNRFNKADYYIEQFTGPSYYFMWPFRQHIKSLLYKNRDKIKAANYEDQPVLKDILEIYKNTR